MRNKATVDVCDEAFIRCAPWSPLVHREQSSSIVNCARDEEKRFFEPIKSLKDFGVRDDNIDCVCEHLRIFKGSEIAKRVFSNMHHWRRREPLNLLDAVDLSVSVKGKNYQAYKAKRVFKGFLRIFLDLCKKLIGSDRRTEERLKQTFIGVFEGLTSFNFTLEPECYESGQKRQPSMTYSIRVVHLPYENFQEHYKTMTNDLNFLCRHAIGTAPTQVGSESSDEKTRGVKRESASEEQETTRAVKMCRTHHEQSTTHLSESVDTPPVSSGSTRQKAFDLDDDVIEISDDDDQEEQPSAMSDKHEVKVYDRCIDHMVLISDDEEQNEKQVLEKSPPEGEFRNVNSQPKKEQENIEGHCDLLYPLSSLSSEYNLARERIIPQNTTGVSAQRAANIHILQSSGTTAACHTPDIHPPDRTVTVDTTVIADTLVTAASILTQSFLDPEMERGILTTAWKSPEVRQAVTHLYAKLMEESSKKIE